MCRTLKYNQCIYALSIIMESTPLNHPKAKIIIIALVAIVIIAVGYVLIKGKSNNVQTSNQQPLTEAEKQAILSELSKQSANQTPLTDKEKSAVLLELSKQSQNQQPLTEAEKQAILNQLSQ